MSNLSHKGSGSFIIIGIIFTVVGFLVLGLGLADYSKAQSMQKWPEVPATIEIAKLTTQTQKKKRSKENITSISYHLKVQYRYQFKGKNYQGDRVNLFSVQPRTKAYCQPIYDQLLPYKNSGKPFRCYVNPKDPTQASLYREIHLLGILLLAAFGFAFALFGMFFFFSGINSGSSSHQENKQKRKDPKRPWLHKEEWKAARIPSSTHSNMAFAFFFTTIWNLISIPATFLVVKEIQSSGDPLLYLFLLFPLVGLTLIYWAIRSAIRWHKFGTSVFEMASVPGVIGGSLAGVIHCNINLAPENGFHLYLKCIKKVKVIRNNKGHMEEKLIWEDVLTLQEELLKEDWSFSAIPVLFAIPYNLPETDERDSNNQILWRLSVKAEIFGVDYEEVFEVPVFKTEKSTPDYALTAKTITPFLANPDLETALRGSGVQDLLCSGGGKKFIFPMMRNIGAALFGFFFCLVWSGITIILIYAKAPVVISLAFLLFAVLMIYSCIDFLLYRSVITVQPNSLSLVSGIFGFGRSHFFNNKDILKIETVTSSRSADSVYYNINLTTVTGKSYCLGKHLLSKAHGEKIVDTLYQILKLKKPEMVKKQKSAFSVTKRKGSSK